MKLKKIILIVLSRVYNRTHKIEMMHDTIEWFSLMYNGTYIVSLLITTIISEAFNINVLK